MATFDADALDILINRGFKPANGYNPIVLMPSHNISYSGYGNVTVQTADSAPPVIKDLGLFYDFINNKSLKKSERIHNY